MDETAMRPPGGMYSARDIFERFGVSRRTLRVFEDEMLLAPGYAAGDASTERLYRPEDLVRIEVILKGRQLGFTLKEIRMLIDYAHQPLPSA